MSNPLADRLRALVIEKTDLVNEEAEAAIDAIVSSSQDLDEKADRVSELAAGDVNVDEVAGALVDLAGIFDSANLNPAQRANLDTVVDRLNKTGTDEQKAALKDLFTGTLDFGVAVRGYNTLLNDLLATEPPVEPGEE